LATSPLIIQSGPFRSPSKKGERNDPPAAKSAIDYLAQKAIDYRGYSQILSFQEVPITVSACETTSSESTSVNGKPPS
jgi:hypothetical protein